MSIFPHTRSISDIATTHGTNDVKPPTGLWWSSPIAGTTSDRAASIARVVLGGVLLPHGLQHALGFLGGYGFSGTFQWMTHTLGFPGPLAAVGIVTELLAPFALLLGLGGRIAAAGLFALMVGAVKAHFANGFFMNWFGRLAPGQEGFEYHILVMALAAVVMVRGSGALSVDRWLTRRPLFSSKNDRA